MATFTIPNNFTAGTTASASQVNQNFTAVANAITDTTIDYSIGNLTINGTTLSVLNNTSLGSNSSDDLTVNSRLASDLIPKSSTTYALGSSSLGFSVVYLGGNSQTVGLRASSSTSASWNLHMPTNSPATSGYHLAATTAGVASWTQAVKGVTDASDATAGDVGEFRYVALSSGVGANVTAGAAFDIVTMTLTPGDWDIWGNCNGSRSSGGTLAWTQALCWIANTTTTVPGDYTQMFFQGLSVNSDEMTFPVPQRQLNITSTTTMYLSARYGFSGTNVSKGGYLAARRRR